MALDIIQVEGCYVSSSLPKALFVPSPSSYKNKRDNVYSSDVLYFKPKKKTTVTKNVISSSADTSLLVEGRQHLSVQTDLYLEELCDVIEEADAQCETDPLLDRPPSPLFVPAKSGPDASTQIYPGELFDFDEEVEPLLEALVGQTLEQALIEIMAEEELAVLSDLQMDYEARRNAEVAEVKRLEEQERRIFEEKEKRMQEHEEAILLEDEVAQKIVACIFSQNYLSELVPQVYKKLEAEGYFETEDPEMLEIEEAFWPWLMNEVDSEIATLEASCHLLDTLIDDTVQSIAETSIIQPVKPDVYPVKKEIKILEEDVEEAGLQDSSNEMKLSDENIEGSDLPPPDEMKLSDENIEGSDLPPPDETSEKGSED
ncbi:radial spoke head protein 3 homolog [Caerostris darwini]|uniref:Radial spoke head protein 3 homolog n=1 Tax=Caerostris darwini TaxID=1538125 RepID=A0AAV4VE25_9ARAC|nr:radial spoke head protein 3 homolog [Caerostris darwini]